MARSSAFGHDSEDKLKSRGCLGLSLHKQIDAGDSHITQQDRLGVLFPSYVCNEAPSNSVTSSINFQLLWNILVFGDQQQNVRCLSSTVSQENENVVILTDTKRSVCVCVRVCTVACSNSCYCLKLSKTYSVERRALPFVRLSHPYPLIVASGCSLTER